MAATLAAGLFFFILLVLRLKRRIQKDYTQYVNTFIGGADNGHTFPAHVILSV